MNFDAVALFGPTGVGKTALSIELAKNIGEIVSVDSMQVYKQMDIGTAKPSIEERKGIKHHLIDIRYPNEGFSTGDFVREATKSIDDIIKRGNIPFLVGGTGLYFNSLLNGISEVPQSDPVIREELNNRHLNGGLYQLRKELEQIDNIYAAKIHPNDKQRTLRALEVYYTTGNNISFYHNTGIKPSPYKFLVIGLSCEREILYQRINKRVELMIEQGFINEVKTLLANGYTPDSPGLSAIGYHELTEYINGLLTLDNAIDQIKKNTRRYAKRQFTWFNKNSGVNWFSANNIDLIKIFVETNLNSKQ